MSPAHRRAPRRRRRRHRSVTHEGRTLRRAGVGSTRGTPPESVTIHLGYGRTRAGRVGNATGFNAYVLRGSAHRGSAPAKCVVTGDDYQLVTTQDHWSLEGRNLVRSAHARGIQGKARRSPRRWSTCALDELTLYPQQRVRRATPVGHGDRPQHLHRLQRLRGRLQSPRTTSRWSARSRWRNARDALAAHRPLLRRRPRQPRHVSYSRCPACTARTRRARWSVRWPPRCTATKA